MAYPSTIPNSFQGYDLTSCCRGDNSFLHTTGDTTSRYLFMRQSGFATIDSAPSPQFASGDGQMYCFKSSDDGQTWSTVGAVNTAASLAVGGSFHGVGPICRDGDIVYFIGMVTSGSTITGLKVFAFDLTTDTWDSGTTFAAPLPLWDTTVPGPLAKLVVLSAGSYLLVFNGPKETVLGLDYRRMYTSTFNGAAFGSAVMVPDETGNEIHYYFTDAIVDGAGSVHILYTLKDDGTGDAIVCHRSLDGLTWSAEQQIAMAFPSSIPFPSAWSNFVIWGSSIGFCGLHNDFSANGQLVFYFGNVADSPTWAAAPIADITQDEVPLGNFTGVIGKVFGLAVSGTTLCIVEALSVAANPPGGQIFYRTASTSAPLAWTSDTLLLDTPAVTQSGATNSADGYGAHAVAAYADADGIAVVAEWECRFTPDSGAEVAQFTLLIPSPPAGGFANVFSYPNCAAQLGTGNYFL